MKLKGWAVLFCAVGRAAQPTSGFSFLFSLLSNPIPNVSVTQKESRGSLVLPAFLCFLIYNPSLLLKVHIGFLGGREGLLCVCVGKRCRRKSHPPLSSHKVGSGPLRRPLSFPPPVAIPRVTWRAVPRAFEEAKPSLKRYANQALSGRHRS